MKTIFNSLSPSKPAEVQKPTSPEPTPVTTPAQTAARQPSGTPGSLPRVGSQSRLPGGHSRSNSLSTVGSTDDLQALRHEVSRLADENASLSAKLEIAPKTDNEVRDMCRKLQTDNRQLKEAIERRVVMGKQNVGSDELWRLKEENKALRDDKARLQQEMEKVTRVATVVGHRLGKMVMEARRSSSGNTQLVDELKRYNRRLEIENDRLYNIIQLTSKNQNVDSRSLVASELPARQQGLNGINSAELIRKLESNQSRLQEDMFKLSRDAANLQSLNAGTTARSDAGSVAPPRTPSLYEEEGLPAPEELRGSVGRNVDEIERLRDELAAAHNSAEQLDMSHTADKQKLKGQIKELKEGAAQSAAERQELQKAVEELEQQGLQLQRDLHALQGCREEAEHLEEENAKLCRDMNKAYEEHAQLADQLASAESSASAAQHRLQQLEETLQQAILVNEQRAQANEEQQHQIQQLERQCHKHERGLASLRSEKAALRSRFSSMDGLTVEHASLQAQLAEAQEARNRAEQEKAAEMQQLSTQLTELQREREELSASQQDAIEQLSAYVSALEREKYELLDSRAMEEAEMNATVATLKQQMQSIVADKACQTMETSAQVVNLQKQRDELLAHKAAETADMGAKITALHAEKEELACSKIEREAELTARIAALEKERDSRAAAQAAELADMAGHVAALQSKVSAWEELKGSHTALAAEMAKLQREKAAMLGAQERTRLGFEAATVELAQNHAKQMHRAQQERRGLETQVSSLRSHASDLETWSSQLETRLSTLSEERQLLEQRSTGELQRLRSSHSTLESQLSHLSSAEAKSSNTASELQRRHSSLLEQHHSLRSQSSMLESEKQQLQIQAAADMQRLQDVNTDLESELGKLRSHASQLETRTFALRGQLQTETSQLLSEKQDLEEQLANETQRLALANTDLGRQLADLKEQNASQQAAGSAQHAQHEAALAALHAEHEELRGQSTAQADKLQAHSATLQQQLDQLRDASLSTEAQSSAARDQLQAEAAAMLAANQALRAQHAEHTARLEVDAANLRDQNDGLRMHVATRTSAFEADKLQLAQRLEQVEQGFSTELSQLHSARSSLQQELEQQQAQRAAAEQQLAAFVAELDVDGQHGRNSGDPSAQLAALRALCSQRDGAIGSLQQQCREKEAALASMTAEHDATALQLRELDEQVTQQGTAHANREAQLKALAAQHNERCAEVARLEDRISEQRERFDRLQSHHDSVAGQLQSELNALSQAHAELQATSGKQLQQSKSDTASLSAQMLTLRRQHSDIHSMSSTAAADLAASRANESDLERRLDAAHAEHAGTSQELHGLSAQFQRLQTNYDALHTDNEQLSQAYDDMRTKHQAYEDAQDARNIQLAQVMLALEEQQAGLARDKEQLQDEVRSLRAQASSEQQSQASRGAEAAAQAREAAASSALLASLVQTAQVSRPEEVSGKLLDLQQQVAALTGEAARATQLHESHMTLLSANQRMSRQLAELQRVGGKAEPSPPGSTATNTPAELTPPVSHRSTSSEELSAHAARGEQDGEVPQQLHNGTSKGLHSPFSAYSHNPTAQPPPPVLPSRPSSPPPAQPEPLQMLDSRAYDMANGGGGSKSKLKFWKRNPLRSSSSARKSTEVAPASSVASADGLLGHGLHSSVDVPQQQQQQQAQPHQQQQLPQQPQQQLPQQPQRQQQRRRPRSGTRTPDPRQSSYTMGADGQLDLDDGTTLLNKLAWEHVQSAYDQFVDQDDVDGFMTKLGFTGFCPPTLPHDLEAAFDAALGVVQPECIPEDADEWDKAMAGSAQALLDTWRALALEEDA